jgi:hypothetical protein
MRLVISRMCIATTVKRTVDLYATTDQLLARSLDIGDNQIKTLGGAGRRRGNLGAKND